MTSRGVWRSSRRLLVVMHSWLPDGKHMGSWYDLDMLIVYLQVELNLFLFPAWRHEHR